MMETNAPIQVQLILEPDEVRTTEWLLEMIKAANAWRASNVQISQKSGALEG
jgi:hypothetical protein